TDTYTLSLHDALPISLLVPHLAHRDPKVRIATAQVLGQLQTKLAWPIAPVLLESLDEPENRQDQRAFTRRLRWLQQLGPLPVERSEEHTSELQSPYDL